MILIQLIQIFIEYSNKFKREISNSAGLLLSMKPNNEGP